MANRLFLTHKQRLFVLSYLRGRSGTEAVMATYNVKNRNTAAVIASENLTKPNIVYVINALAPNSYILEESIRNISEGLNATKGVKGLPDWNTRLKASKMGMKLLDEIYK